MRGAAVAVVVAEVVETAVDRGRAVAPEIGRVLATRPDNAALPGRIAPVER
jgi:hypothetical protein